MFLPPILIVGVLELQIYAATLGFLRGFPGSNSGPQAYIHSKCF